MTVVARDNLNSSATFVDEVNDGKNLNPYERLRK